MVDDKRSEPSVAPTIQKSDFDHSPETKQKRSYYYDDAHGYEEYDPKDGEDEEEDAKFED